jgi:hypothetical protein
VRGEGPYNVLLVPMIHIRNTAPHRLLGGPRPEPWQCEQGPTLQPLCPQPLQTVHGWTRVWRLTVLQLFSDALKCGLGSVALLLREDEPEQEDDGEGEEQGECHQIWLVVG